MARSPFALTVFVAAGLAAAACSAAPAPTAPGPATAARDTATACRSLVAFDARTVEFPGDGPGSPPPTAEAVKAWAATATGPFDALARNVPADLGPSVATMRAALDAATRGAAVDTEDTGLTRAGVVIDKWGHDTCGFTKLAVVGTGTEVSGVPATLPAGPLSISYTNGGQPDKGFVLLLGKVKDGAQYTLSGLRDGSVDGFEIVDVVAAAAPTPEEPTMFSHATLAPGRYLALSPLGTPPAFTGTLVAEFTVS